MIIRKLVLPVLLFAGTLHAQDDVLFTIDGNPTTIAEFDYVFGKNRNIGNDIDPKTPEEYLDLYINFKLKVQEAKELGLDTSLQFKREFRSYRNQLAKPYMMLKDVEERLVQEAYSHMMWDVRARHIMLDMPENALPGDTARVYARIMDIREKIIDGEMTFDAAARQFSTDTYTAREGGDLGWFTVFDMVYPFEKAAYNLEPEEISMPVRTQFGYHLIETTDKRLSRGNLEVAHILVYSPEPTPAEEDEAAKRKIDEIYNKARSGEDFAVLAQQYSDDKKSAEKGGLLPVFGMKDMLPEFEEAAFGLSANGQISAPFRTQLGWHIVKRIKHYPIETLDNLREEISIRVKRDSRSDQGREAFLNKIKNEYEFETDDDALMEIINSIDKSYLNGEWNAEAWHRANDVVFEFADIKIKQKDVARWLSENDVHTKAHNDAKQWAYGFVQDRVEQEILRYEEEHLGQKYPEYKWLVQEYHNGILLFERMQERVWTPATTDTMGLQNYYDAHRNQYQYKTRYRAVKVSSTDEDRVEGALQDLEEGNSHDQLRATHNVESELALMVDTVEIPFSEAGELHEEAEGEAGTFSAWQENELWVGYRVLEILPAGDKPLNVVRGEVMSDYQKYLEEQWLRELKEKYPVKVKKKVFNKWKDQL